LTPEQAAAGIIRIANANMERAVRVSSAEKGYDPRDITLVAFGGAGPLHAAALATAVGIPTVLVPEQPGVFSAVGLVMADIRHDFVRTKIIRGDDINDNTLSPLYAELEAEANAALERDSIGQDQRHLERSADFRYIGQAYEVNVPVLAGELDAANVLAAISAFHETHLQLYAHNHHEKPLEFVSARVAAIGRMSAPPIRSQAKKKRQAVAKECRPVYFDELTDYTETNVYDRSELTPGTTLDGPAIVEQVDTTVLIHPGQKAEVDAQANLLIHTES